MDAIEALVRSYARVQRAPFVPQFRLWLADELVPLWQATESLAAGPRPPPFWAFAWPGSLALARYLIDHPTQVKDLRVLDFGAGGGLAAIAATHLGAAHVLACDLDPIAGLVQRMNAALNGVVFESKIEDAAAREFDTDVVLAGDVCYEREASARITPWLRGLVDRGTSVLLADPGRLYAPSDDLQLLAAYDVPTLHELESATHKRTHVWRLLPAQRATMGGVHCGA
jgi:predicted nicotinamide N-methyase